MYVLCFPTCFPDEFDSEWHMCLINLGKWYYVRRQAYLMESCVKRGLALHVFIAKIQQYKIVVFSNWNCSLHLYELGCKDKVNKSGHPIKQAGKFPFWCPFSFVSCIALVKEHSSWNEIKGFIYFYTNLAWMTQIRQRHFIKRCSSTILITCEISVTKAMREWLKAWMSHYYE